MSAPAVAGSRKHNKYVVAWKDMRKGEPNIYWSVSAKPEFSQESLVHDSTRGAQDHPSVAIDVAGKAWIAWEDSRDRMHTIRMRREGGPEFVVTDGPNASFPVVACGRGTVGVVYESGTRGRKSVYFRALQQPESSGSR